MIATWMLYSLLLAALLGAAAWAGERALRLYRRPTRWPWAIAIPLAALLPPALWLAPPRPAPRSEAAAAVEGWVEVVTAAPAAVTAAVSTPGFAVPTWLDPLLLAVWLTASLLLLAWYILSALSVRRSRRGWRWGVVADVPVYLSKEEGPAVVGVARPVVIVPRCILAWNDALQRLIVEHEREHIRARDPLLLRAALAALLIMPWNLALWWMVRRLWLAVEVDCDARVLHRQSDVRGYGNLLLEVGRLRSRALRPAAAFSEPVSFLERRIHIMTRRRPSSYRLQAAGFAAAAVLALAAACQIDRPATLEPEAVPAPLTVPTTDLARAPTFTPYERAPEFQNRAEFQRVLMQAYPPALREAGIGGTVRLWVFIDEEGVMRNTRVVESSGHAALDNAAEAVMREARFAPALNRGQQVPVWVQFPVTFSAQESAQPDR